MPANEIELAQLARTKRSCFDLRVNDKWTYRAIAEELNLSVSTVRHYVAEMRIVLMPTEDADEIRQTDADGYDASERLTLTMINRVTQALDSDTTEGNPLNDKRIELLAKLNEQLMQIRKSRALLLGLNAPVTVNHNLKVRTDFDEQIEALTSELLGGGNVMSSPDNVLAESE